MNRDLVIVASILIWVVTPFMGYGQRSSIISRNADLFNNMNISLSYGEIIQKRNAWFYGFSAEYSRRLKNAPVGVGLSIMWDSETDKAKSNPVKSFSGALAGSYLVTERFSLGAGLAKGLINDENPNRTYKFANGDLSTGLMLAYTFPMGNQSLIGLTSSLEYNLSQREFSLSLDLSYAFSW